MWSDPDDIETWVMSNRGAGWIFGWKVVNEVKILYTKIIIYFSLLIKYLKLFIVQSFKRY